MDSNIEDNIIVPLNELQDIKKSLKLVEGRIEGLLKEKQGIVLPVSLFNSNLSPFEVIVKYLRDTLNKKFSEIAYLTGRDPRTVWGTYSRAKKKGVALNVRKGIEIPLSLFRNRQFSCLEHICRYLHDTERLGFSEISRLICKDPRTIWTCYNRAKQKVAKSRR